MPVKRINAIVWVQRYKCELEEGLETLGDIISNDINQINQMDIIPLVNDLEILGIFKDKDREEGDSVMDALSTML